MRIAAEAEKSVLCSCLLDAAPQVSDRLEPEMFHDSRNRMLYKSIRKLLSINAPVDVSTVISNLRQTDKTAEVGEDYLRELMHYECRLANLDYYVSEVRRAYFQREIEATAYRVYKEPSDETLEALQRLAVARDSESATSYFNVKRDVMRAVEELEKPLAEKELLDTGIKALDLILYGLKRGDMWTIGARPGHGKTALLTKLGVAWGSSGYSVLMFTTEMLELEIMNRILSPLAKVPAWRLRRKAMAKEHIEQIREAASGLQGKCDLTLAGRKPPAISDIRAAVVKLKPDIVIVDYLQRCIFPPGDNMAYRVNSFLAALKTMALETGVRVLIGAQMKRDTDYNSKKSRPKMADLRDSGAIEEQSDAVTLLHNVTSDESLPFYDVEAIQCKTRNGARGLVHLIFEKDFIHFCEGSEEMVVHPDARGEEEFYRD